MCVCVCVCVRARACVCVWGGISSRWLGWDDWLDTPEAANVVHKKAYSKYLPFPEAMNFVRKLGLRNGLDYEDWCGTTARPASQSHIINQKDAEIWIRDGVFMQHPSVLGGKHVSNPE